MTPPDPTFGIPLDAAELDAEDRWIEGEADDLRRWLMDETAPLPASVRAEVRAAAAVQAPTAPEWTGDPLALSLAGAASALGVSEDHFAAHVKPELKVIRRGRRQLVAVAELRRWLDRAGERTL